MILPAIAGVVGLVVLVVGAIAATTESPPGQTNYLDRRFAIQNKLEYVPQQNTRATKRAPKVANAAPATTAVAAAPKPVTFTTEGKDYKTPDQCLTDAWLAGLRDPEELRKLCPGK